MVWSEYLIRDVSTEQPQKGLKIMTLEVKKKKKNGTFFDQNIIFRQICGDERAEVLEGIGYWQSRIAHASKVAVRRQSQRP